MKKQDLLKKGSSIALVATLVGSQLMTTIPFNVLAAENTVNAQALPYNAVTVENWKELNAALTSAAVTDIYLDADIKMEGHVLVYSTTKNIHGNKHTLDMAGYYVALMADNTVGLVEDLKITNTGIYSLFWSEAKNVEVTYRNVDHTGGQMSYIKTGRLIIEGTVTAHVSKEEAFEGKELIIKDNATANFYSTSPSGNPTIYLMTAPGILTVGKNATLTTRSKVASMRGDGNNTITNYGTIDMQADTEKNIALYGNSSIYLKDGSSLKTVTGEKTHESILVQDGNLFAESGSTLDVTSNASETALQTGSMLKLAKGSNFSITNLGTGPALGSFASPTDVTIDSDQGVSTWDVKNVTTPVPTASYSGPFNAQFTLSGYGSVTQTNMTSNNALFASQFKSNNIGKITGGSFAYKEIDKTTINAVDSTATTVTGVAEPNADVVLKVGSTVIGQGKVGSDGKYSITIPKQAVGTIVTATATLNSQTSAAQTTVVRGELVATTIDTLTADSTVASGTAEPNAAIEIKNAAGTVIASGTVGSDGRYSLTIPKQAEGTVVTATATKDGKTATGNTTVQAGQSIAKTVIDKVTTDSTTATGTAEPNAKIEIKNAAGTVIASGTVGSDGKYSLTIAKQAEGTVLTATATKGDKTSDANATVIRESLDTTTMDTLTADSTVATGTAEPNAAIEIKNAAGTVIASGTVGSDGKYSLTIPKQAANTVVTATATKGGKTATGNTTVQAGQNIAKTTIEKVTTDSVSATGTAEPNAAIEIKNAAGTVIASGTVGSDGKYSLTIAKQAEGTVLTATATKDGKTSDANATVIRESLDPTTINTLKGDSTVATGTAEPNAKIEIKNAAGTVIASGTVGSDGKYSLTIPKQAEGTVLTATATKDGKTSSVNTTVAPGQSISETTINPLNNDATTVSGKGEPNADIVIKSGSTTIATGKVGSDGNYSLTIPKQAENTVLTATATKDGKTSSATTTVAKQATGSIVVTAPYYVGYDSNVQAKVSDDAVKVYLQVGNTKYTTVPVSGSFGYYAKDKITTTSQDAYLVALDTSGKELSRAKVTLKDGALLKGTVAADEFIVGATNYVTGSFTGSVTKVAISVNGTVYPAVAVGTGNKLQYYAKDKIINKTDTVKLIGYNAEGTSIATADVSVAGPDSLTGTITPNPSNFAISTDSYVKGTFTGNVKTVSLVVNGVESAKVSVMDATNWQYYAKGKIVNPTDVVSVKGYNAAGTLVDTKTITVSQNPAGQSTITPAAFKLKTDTYVKGTFTGSVKYVALKVGDTTYSKVAVVDGTNWQYYAKDKITDATTPVSIIGYDSTGTQIVTENVTVTPENTSTLTADKYTLGDSNVTGKYTGAVKYVGVKINDTTYSKVPVNADGSYQYYIKDKVGSKDDVITVLGYDSTGAVVAQETATIDPGVAPTMTADEFLVGTTKNVTGTFTGGVKYVGLQVGGTVYSKVPVNADGTYQYYAKDKIADTATTVTVLGYDSTGAVAVQAVVAVK
ncbi:autolysin modifier protein [Listeria booriae]|uniref:Autolysin modifier protein n=1 Tax=Listeria booriae TaxID=1552123 RepID=A0A7X1A3S3_9LIST|nr:immunoglobulin-like domain-containing protein [Listeria booriae]MBC2370743.1 autolysin modifier protein [Listeria booriae]